MSVDGIPAAEKPTVKITCPFCNKKYTVSEWLVMANIKTAYDYAKYFLGDFTGQKVDRIVGIAVIDEDVVEVVFTQIRKAQLKKEVAREIRKRLKL